MGSKRGGLEDGTALLWEVRVREVTESGVEWLWQEFIVGNLEVANLILFGILHL